MRKILNAKYRLTVSLLIVFALLLCACSGSGGETTELTTVPTVATTESAEEPTTNSAEENTDSTAEETSEPTTEETTESTTEPTVALEESTFAVHFIDVGQADSALVLCDGKAMLIDGGNVSDSSLLYSYLKNNGVDHLDYVIGTHSHEDHIGGLAGALNYATVDTVYCPVTSADTEAFGNFVKAVEKNGATITVPSVGMEFSLGRANCKVLAVGKDNSDPNNTSIVLRVVYGATSFLFTGDAESTVESVVADSFGEEIKSTVLKVGHHGSDTSTSYYWLRTVDPDIAVISVGEGNSYGHPTETTLNLLRDAEVKTYRTDMQGDIICTSDGTSVSVEVEKNPDAVTLGLTPEEKLTQIVNDSVYNYNHKSNRILTGTLTFIVVSKDQVDFNYEVDEAIYTNTEYLVDEVLDEILAYIKTDIGNADASGLFADVSLYANANYTFYEGNAPGTETEPVTEATEDNGRDYVVNTNTDKFHYPGCSSAKQIKEKNRWDYHGTRDELIDMGYVPCKKCNP